jgi:hypothetical protein
MYSKLSDVSVAVFYAVSVLLLFRPHPCKVCMLCRAAFDIHAVPSSNARVEATWRLIEACMFNTVDTVKDVGIIQT